MGGVVNFLTGSPDDPLPKCAGAPAAWGSAAQRSCIASATTADWASSCPVGYRESDGDPDSSDVASRWRGEVRRLAPITGVRPTTDPDGSPRYWVGTQGARPWSQSNAQPSFHYSLSASTKLVAGAWMGRYSVGYSRPDSFLRDAAGGPVYSGAVLFGDAGTTRRLTLSQTDCSRLRRPVEARPARVPARNTASTAAASSRATRHAAPRLLLRTGGAGSGAYDSGPGNLTDQPNRRIDPTCRCARSVSPTWALVGGMSLNRSTLDRTVRTLAAWRNADAAGAVQSADGGRATTMRCSCRASTISITG
ncbi:MAG: hypothetical protein R3E41_12155 [Burkholderiaceae bacterium]